MIEKATHAVRYLLHDQNQLMDSIVSHFFKWLPDKTYLKLRFRYSMGYKLNLDDPKTFNEKIQWLKLFHRVPGYTQMVDKYAVKEYVASIIGEEYVIPTLGVWDSPEEINWDNLPQQFVLKTTHGGGNEGVVICRNKDSLDKRSIAKALRDSLQQDIYRNLREWPYKNVRKRILAETLLSDEIESTTIGDGDLQDYKFYCFNGIPYYCQVIRNRRTKEVIDFYDMDWNHMPFVGLNPIARNGDVPVPCPSKLEKMISICQELSSDKPFVRVDLYLVNGSIYFGELTFYPFSGFGTFTPSEWNDKLGNLLILPR